MCTPDITVSDPVSPGRSLVPIFHQTRALVSLSLITRQRRFVSSSIIFGGLKTLIDDISALGSFSANRA